ncbi:lytic murein transglycosylase [Aquamicrobium zhengzhouense]|uniref:Lytic murein transglycosylase n=1 Tax=Aquamicrobium zhengzhouense TaxID=2781738 RepID=A0ABS0S8S1_9HYPH|nr:lytic murein transglycosylase [Aquamicrobium zhengzhouense]MBI1619684.1 lytic murein transglycosylase [Aquamicrobium zhengzhouense]
MFARMRASRLVTTSRALCLALSLTLPTSAAFADAQFQRWVSQFRATALNSGVSAQIFDRAFAGVTAPDPEVLRLATNQPEFTAPVWQYFDNQVNEQSITNGRQMAKQHRRTLDVVEKRFGVDRNIILGIWSIESRYGEALSNPSVVRNIVTSLSTLAYADKRRQKFARQQLIAALKIVQNGDVSVKQLTGSWAGAMGHTQFIPTSYQTWAVDLDGNGKRDIWNSIPDALGSAANLLKQNGWRTGHAWGYEVVLPAGRKFPAGRMTLAQWQAIGVVRANGQAYPRPNDQAELKVLDGREGPAFLVLHNFNVLKRYNSSDRYAIAVGLLADQIAGHNPPRRDWNRPFTRLTFAETQELQKRLSAHGFYNGEIDGRIGSGSREAIRAMQARLGMPQDGHPSKELLTRLRRQ